MRSYWKSTKLFGMKLLEKYKAIWNKIEDLKNIELNLDQFMMTDI